MGQVASKDLSLERDKATSLSSLNSDSNLDSWVIIETEEQEQPQQQEQYPQRDRTSSTAVENHKVLTETTTNTIPQEDRNKLPIVMPFQCEKTKNICAQEDEARPVATFRYTVENISKMKDSQVSPAYYVRYLPWKILVRQTQEEQLPKSLGFFLWCNTEDESTSWSCYAVAELRLLSCKEGQEPFSKKIKHLFCYIEDDWGFHHFMTWKDVLDPDRGFIKDDSITLEVYVKAAVPLGLRSDVIKNTGYIDLKNRETLNNDGGDGTDNCPINGEPKLECIVQDQEEEEKKEEEETLNNGGGDGTDNCPINGEPKLECVVQDQEKEDETVSEATFQYTVKNISKIKGLQMSPAFYVGNLTWQIILMVPHSSQTQKKELPKSLGFFLQCNTEDKSTSWSCYTVGRLSILSCNGQKTFSKIFYPHYFHNRAICHGYSDFITWEDVLDPDQGFIENDSITLEVHLHAVLYGPLHGKEIIMVNDRLEQMLAQNYLDYY